jgi:hypothetical protein
MSTLLSNVSTQSTGLPMARTVGEDRAGIIRAIWDLFASC